MNGKPKLSDQALSAHSDGSLFTLKLTEDAPVERNSLSSIDKRQKNAVWLMEQDLVNAIKYFENAKKYEFNAIKKVKNAKFSYNAIKCF